MRFGDKVDLRDCYHLLEEHVKVDDKDLILRLQQGDIDYDGVYIGHRTNIATKFHSEKIATWAVSMIIAHNEPLIKEWLRFRSEKYLRLRGVFTKSIGYGIAKGTKFSKHYEMYACRVVLKLGYNGDIFEIATAFPECNEGVRKEIERDRIKFREEKSMNPNRRR